MKKLFSVIIVTLFTLSVFAQITIVSPTVEYRDNPVGLDVAKPRFGWKLTSAKRNVMQSAYEIRVSTDVKALTNGQSLLWSSGKVSSDRSVHVEYGGPTLTSGQRYYWQVRAWDNAGKASAWTSPAYWQMGLLNTGDWKAEWIGPGYQEDSVVRQSPFMRAEFSVSKRIAAATAYVTAHGMYEAFINGQRVGDAYLTPGWTSYHNRLQYQTYDVTDLLKAGDNAIGASLGSGWYRGKLAWEDGYNHYGKDIALLFQLDITYTDGSKESVVSDGSWKSTIGPIISSELYDGEVYDARKELTGWSSAGYDDSKWSAVAVQNYPKDVLVATYNEPVRKRETIKPIRIFKTPKGEQVVDFGQNMVGWVQVNVSGNPGDKITIAHAEVLDKEGNFYTTNLRAADQQNTYILKGGGQETFEPTFTFQGFRYIRVEGLSGEPTKDNFLGVALYSDMKQTGTFTTSNALLNQLQHNIQWGQRGNFLDVPTDCPQRDERLGWTGDAQAFSRTAAYNFGTYNFFAKWLKDVAADQIDGSVPFVVPNVLGKGAAGSAGWGDAATIIPWNMYLAYGDTRILEDQYESMKAWVEWIGTRSNNDLWNTGFHFGDWLFYRPFDDNDGRAAVTDKYMIAQCFYAHSTQLLINTARVLGNAKDVVKYADLLSRIKEAYMKEYVTANGRLVSGTQTAYVLALQFDMLPEQLRGQAAERLAENVKSYDNHLTTGFLGTPYLTHVLSRYGYDDLAYTLLLQKTYPSWLYPVTMGATTIWERWDGMKPDSTFQTPSMNSFNHYAYGAIGDWMYRNITGLDTEPQAPGYKKIVIKPVLGGELTRAEAKLETNYGQVTSGWKLDGKSLTMAVEVPVNTTATVYVPGISAVQIREGGKALIASKDIKVIGAEGEYVKLELGSGRYSFVSQLP